MVDGALDGGTAASYSYANTLRALGQDTALAGEMLAYWQDLVLAEAIPFADTYSVLSALREKYTTGILTNGFTALQRKKIDRYKLADYVDFTLVSEEVGYHKPDKRIYLKALQMAGNPLPDQTLYVGDNPINDIQGPQAVGITPILINPTRDVDPPDGVIRIQQLSELISLLDL